MRTFERLDEIIRWLVIAMIGLVPFFFVPVAWISTVQSKMLVLGLLMIAIGVLWIVARFLEGIVRIPWVPALAAAALLPIVYAISTALTGFESASLIGSGVETDTLAFVALSFAILFITSSVFGMHPRHVNHALRALLFGGTLLVVLELAHFIMPSWSWGGVFIGQTGNAFGGWHELVMFAGLMLFSSLSFLESPVTRGLWKYAAWTTVALSGLLLVIANYFDVWMLVLAAFLLLIAARGYRAKQMDSAEFWKGQKLSLGVAALALFFLVFGAYIVNVLPPAIRVSQNDVRPSLQGTLAIGQQSLARPATLLFGAGPNTFTREWGLYKPVDVNQTPFWDTSFTVGVASLPTAFITVGLVGLLVWIAFILSIFWMILRFLRAPTHSPATVLAVPVCIALLYLVALQILTIPGTMLTLLLFLLLGVLIALLTPLYEKERMIALGKNGLTSWLWLGGVAALSLALIFSAGMSARVVYAEALVNRSIVTYNQSQDLERSSHYISEALAVYPGDDRAHRTAVQLGLLSLQKLLAAPDASQDAAKVKLQATLKETIQHGLDAVSINGNDYQNWLSLASLYAQLAGSNIDGAYEGARNAFNKALAENPTSPVPYINLAQLDLLQKNPTAALQDLAKAVQLKPDLAAAYYLASQIYAGQNDLKSALTAAASAAKYASGDSQAWYNLGIIAYAAKDYQDAGSALQQALVIQPQFANAMYVLGLTYYQLHDTANALAAFRALDKLDPGHDVVTQIIADIIAGKPLAQAEDPQAVAATSTKAKLK